jgi:hypothetical protein
MLDPTASDPDSPPPATPPIGAESYARIMARPLGVIAALALVWALGVRPGQGPVPVPTLPASPTPAPAPVVVAEVPRPAPRKPRPAAPAPPPPPVAPPLDRTALAEAEEALDAASRDRARAEGRLAAAERALQVATTRAATDAASNRTLAFRVRDPSARIASASTRAGAIRTERDRLAKEVAALEKAPVPRAKALLAKSAVAKPTDGIEYHFEVRRDRVSFIDLDRLVDQVKSDARLRLRLGGSRGVIASTVGPVGSFSLRYQMGRAISENLADLLDARDVTYTLRSWEVIPEAENRGEGYEATKSTTSDFGRAIRRLNPERDTITMWIYPDGFQLYRQLRDDLHARGFMVAARPLPAGMAIRGSPVGSLSAGQ